MRRQVPARRRSARPRAALSASDSSLWNLSLMIGRSLDLSLRSQAPAGFAVLQQVAARTIDTVTQPTHHNLKAFI
jgi:hypothetical protein